MFDAAQQLTTTTTRLSMALFVFLASLYLLTFGSGPRTVNEWSVYWMAESVAERGALDMPQVDRVGMFYGLRGRGGRFYSPNAVLPSVMTAPFNAAAKAVDGLVLQTSGPRGQAQLVAMLTSTISVAVIAGTGVLVLLCLIELGVAPQLAGVTAVIYGTGTLAWPYTGYLFREPFLAFFLIAAFWQLLVWRSPSENSWKPVVYASLFLGCAFLCKREAIFSYPGLGLLTIWPTVGAVKSWSNRLKAAAIIIAGPFLAGCWQLGWNLYRYGDVFELGYPVEDETGAELVAFSSPMLEGLWGLLLSYGKGVIWFSPPIILAAIGMVLALLRKQPWAFAVSTVVVTNLLVFSVWGHWEGGWSWGPRYTLSWQPLAMLGLGWLLHEIWSFGKAAKLATAVTVGAFWTWGIAAQLCAVFVDYFWYAVESRRYIINLNDYQMDWNPWPGHFKVLSLQLRSFLAGNLPNMDIWQVWFIIEGGNAAIPVVAIGTGVLGIFFLASGVYLAYGCIFSTGSNSSAPNAAR